jgi:hypothetical protein
MSTLRKETVENLQAKFRVVCFDFPSVLDTYLARVAVCVGTLLQQLSEGMRLFPESVRTWNILFVSIVAGS